MKIRLHVEDFEIEIGGSDRHHPLAQAVGLALAPGVTRWLEANASRFWPKPTPAATEEDDGEPSRHVVDGAAAAPTNGTPAAEV
jgi:hypothetical protein